MIHSFTACTGAISSMWAVLYSDLRQTDGSLIDLSPGFDFVLTHSLGRSQPCAQLYCLFHSWKEQNCTGAVNLLLCTPSWSHSREGTGVCRVPKAGEWAPQLGWAPWLPGELSRAELSLPELSWAEHSWAELTSVTSVTSVLPAVPAGWDRADISISVL